MSDQAERLTKRVIDQVEDIALLRACNDSLHSLCAQVWKALEPSGEYEGHLGLVEFANSVRAERDALRNELNMVDEALARRPALADASDRYTKIFRACEMAGKADALHKRVQELASALEDLHDAVEARADSGKRRALTVSPKMEESLLKAQAALKGE